MAIQSYFDEFKQNYERPQVDGLIVGFSGIDPQRKSSNDSSYNTSTLSQEQRDIVRQLIREALSVIDFSQCDCDPTQLSDEQKDIITRLIEQKIEELNICECDNSTLSDKQLQIIKNFIDDRLAEINIYYDGGEINDNLDDDEHQHEPLPVDEANLDHEKLQNLLGGDANGHFHLTQDELLKVASYPAFSQIKHELLPDLMGGKVGEHFHLDSNQFKKLDILISTFFPDGSDKVIIVPNAPYSPDNPDNTDNTPDDYDPYGGLPSGTPPDWDIRMLPSNMQAADFGKVFYYGDLLGNGGKTLFTQIQTSNTLKQQHTYSLSSDVVVWNYEYDCTSAIRNASSDSGILQYVYVDNPPNGLFTGVSGNPTWIWAVVVIPKVSKAGKLPYFYETQRINDGLVKAYRGAFTPKTDANYIAGAYSPIMQKFIIVTDKQYICKKSTGGSWSSKYLAFTVNQACAAWHPNSAVFCLTGKEGTSTSFDGETWTLNKDAPHDLRELSYREDIDNFVAWSGEDKTFYASTDGINWTQLSDTPIPLENISTVHYEPSLQWYCAVGLGDGNAYFSKDLIHWIPTKLRNNSPVDVADVIFMPSTANYVAMPTSGTYYYTFKPSDWTD